MSGSQRVLIADTVAAVRELQAMLDESVDVVPAETFEQAVRRFAEAQPGLVIVGYHFDELRPFRLIQHLRYDVGAGSVPIMLVRKLAPSLAQSVEEQMREAYESLGVAKFVNLYDEEQRFGAEAAARAFRDQVTALLEGEPAGGVA